MFQHYARLHAGYLLGLQQHSHYTLAVGTGTYGYEPNVSYFFGFPRAIKPGGVAMNLPIAHVTGQDANDTAKKRDYLFQVGLISSALEHAVPEQMFTNAQNPGEGISAVKALQKANAQGQRIYHITPANQATALPNIHHDSSTMAEIQNALNAGLDVITHTDAVSVPGWTGAGYIIFDADTGGGAFKIAGGGNGGFLFYSGVFFALMSIILLFFASAPGIGILSAIIFNSLITFSLSGFFAAITALLHLEPDTDATAFIDWGGLTLAGMGSATVIDTLIIGGSVGTAGIGAAILGLAFALAAVLNDFPK